MRPRRFAHWVRLAHASIALLFVVSACNSPALRETEAVETAMRIAASQADGPVAVEFVRQGLLGQFLGTARGADANRRVWAVGLVGSFEGEGVRGNVPRFGHYLVILDAETGEYLMGAGSS